MAYQFPPAVDQLVKEHMASGHYASEDDVLLDALRSLSDYKQTIADVQEGMEDERAGRVQTLQEVDAELRSEFNIPKDA